MEICASLGATLATDAYGGLHLRSNFFFFGLFYKAVAPNGAIIKYDHKVLLHGF